MSLWNGNLILSSTFLLGLEEESEIYELLDKYFDRVGFFHVPGNPRSPGSPFPSGGPDPPRGPTSPNPGSPLSPLTPVDPGDP